MGLFCPVGDRSEMSTQNGYKTYIATRSFSLGSDGTSVAAGSEVEFDGTRISYGGMPPVVSPQVRGAIRLGWLVSAADYDPETVVLPESANIRMRPAVSGDPAHANVRQSFQLQVDEEEREVGSVLRHAAETRERNSNNYRRRTPRSESTAGTLSSSNVAEEQYANEVHGVRFQVPTGQEARRTFTDISRAGEVISAVQKIKVRPGKGRTREELLRDAISRGNLTDAEYAEYMEELEACRSAHNVATTDVVGFVAKPKNSHKEGVDIATSVGGGVAIEDLSTGVSAPAVTSVVEADGIKFTNTNGPKKGKKPQLVETTKPGASTPEEDLACRTIAKAVCPDFPDNYVFTDPYRKKMARLQADYDNRPDVIRAVAAAETDMHIRSQLLKDFPEAFTA